MKRKLFVLLTITSMSFANSTNILNEDSSFKKDPPKNGTIYTEKNFSVLPYYHQNEDSDAIKSLNEESLAIIEEKENSDDIIIGFSFRWEL